jgi:hypothetical protein
MKRVLNDPGKEELKLNPRMDSFSQIVSLKFEAPHSGIGCLGLLGYSVCRGFIGIRALVVHGSALVDMNAFPTEYLP